MLTYTEQLLADAIVQCAEASECGETPAEVLDRLTQEFDPPLTSKDFKRAAILKAAQKQFQDNQL
jgi:hypothetical protein